MFLIYINDLPDNLGNVRAKLYANTTVLYHAGKNPQIVTSDLQLVLNTLSEWCINNRLTINAKKMKSWNFPNLL